MLFISWVYRLHVDDMLFISWVYIVLKTWRSKHVMMEAYHRQVSTSLNIPCILSLDIQPLADRVAHNLEIISKNCQFSIRHTMGFIIADLVLMVNPVGRILFRWKSFRNNLQILCRPISAIGCLLIDSYHHMNPSTKKTSLENPPDPMNHVTHLRAGPPEMPLRKWYNCGTNHFYLTSVVRWK